MAASSILRDLPSALLQLTTSTPSDNITPTCRAPFRSCVHVRPSPSCDQRWIVTSPAPNELSEAVNTPHSPKTYDRTAALVGTRSCLVLPVKLRPVCSGVRSNAIMQCTSSNVSIWSLRKLRS